MDYNKLFERACDYLSRREHTKVELKTKLRRKFAGASDDLIDKVVDDLESLGLQSNERFEEVFIRSSYYRKYGPRKIRFDLGTKGIKIDSSKDLDISDEQFFDQAYDLVRIRYHRDLKRYEKMNFEDKQKVKKKMFDLLARRGFEYGMIKRVVEEVTLHYT